MKHSAKAAWVGAASAIANAGYTYSRALDEAFDTRLDDLDRERANKALVNSMMRSMSIVDRNINDIDKIMNTCSATLSHN
ncbi:MAG: hypothetical protein JF593_04665 [Novosphingobium sp.]|nr:hypothetical protein [Novosphingobium sp.]